MQFCDSFCKGQLHNNGVAAYLDRSNRGAIKIHNYNLSVLQETFIQDHSFDDDDDDDDDDDES